MLLTVAITVVERVARIIVVVAAEIVAMDVPVALKLVMDVCLVAVLVVVINALDVIITVLEAADGVVPNVYPVVLVPPSTGLKLTNSSVL